MIEWLKTSIAGLIILGAIGSLLAVGILKIAALSIQRFFKPALHSLAGRAFVLIRSPHYIIEYLRSSNDPQQLIVTYILLASTFICFTIFMAAGLIMVTLGTATSRSGSIAYTHALIISSGSFLFGMSAFFGLIALRYIWQIY